MVVEVEFRLKIELLKIFHYWGSNGTGFLTDTVQIAIKHLHKNVSVNIRIYFYLYCPCKVEFNVNSQVDDLEAPHEQSK